jgi:SAM-dependent methyltransferase
MNKSKLLGAYRCPVSLELLSLNQDTTALKSTSGISFPLMTEYPDEMMPCFLVHSGASEANEFNLGIYNQAFSSVRYRNELNWLFETFGEEEGEFRKNLISGLHLKPGHRVLVTACGLGNDIAPIARVVGEDGVVYAQDLAAEMIYSAWKLNETLLSDQSNIHYSVSDASSLPFADDYFDSVFHFGGINLFDDIRQATHEMARVVKKGGRVVFGDESVAPWLRGTAYGKMAMFNNSLWEANVPLELLPANICDVKLSWVLGNCFYLIGFTKSDDLPYMNPDVKHIGPRGGTMRTRYSGRLEGVTEESKAYAIEAAKISGVSIHEWLESLIREKKSRGSGK